MRLSVQVFSDLPGAFPVADCCWSCAAAHISVRDELEQSKNKTKSILSTGREKSTAVNCEAIFCCSS